MQCLAQELAYEVAGTGILPGPIGLLDLPRPPLPAAGPDTPCIRAYAPFLGRSPGTGAFVPRAYPRSRVALLG